MALPKKTGEEIVKGFELQVDDLTELSTAEEYIILDRVYQRVCADRPWEFLKVPATGTILSDSDGSYLTLPTDFNFVIANNATTLNSQSINNNAVASVIFVGTNYRPVQLVNWSDRRQYRDNNSYAYVDLVNDQIRFLGTPSETTYEFDYIKVPEVITASTYPLIPGRFHDMLTYAMAMEDDILQKSEKARSYLSENTAKYTADLSNLAYWNAQFYMD